MNFGKRTCACKNANVDLPHIDVMDGHLVEDIAFGAVNVAAICANTDLCVDVHLMLAEPQRFAKRMLEAGAGIVTLQLEPCLDLYRTICMIKDTGARACVCISRPETPVWMLEETAQMVDGVLLVAVPLVLAEKFIPSMYEKIKKLSEWKREKGYHGRVVQRHGGAGHGAAGPNGHAGTARRKADRAGWIPGVGGTGGLPTTARVGVAGAWHGHPHPRRGAGFTNAMPGTRPWQPCLPMSRRC